MLHVKFNIRVFMLATMLLAIPILGIAQLDNPNVLPNPYITVNPGEQDWVTLPDGRRWGGNYIFDQPCDVVVVPNGDIFVADGHSPDGNNRIVKYNSTGECLLEWGGTGAENGELRVPHALAMDTRGLLFVADRGNSRLQIFEQDGSHVDTWTQFGRPSGLYIDGNDILYAADSESNTGPSRNPGWYRGIRIGSAINGFVTVFIPDPNTGGASGTSAAKGVTADELGNVYGAEVAQRKLRKYSPRSDGAN